MADEIQLAQMWDYAIDRVREHFADCRLDELSTVERVFATTIRPDLEGAIHGVLNAIDPNYSICGIGHGDRYDALSFLTIIKARREPPIIGPLEYMDIDVGTEQPARCLQQGLYQFQMNGAPAALLISQVPRFMTGQSGVRIEVVSSPLSGGFRSAQLLMASVVAALAENSIYKGRTLSFETGRQHSGALGALKVHRLPDTKLSDVILPQAILETLERTVFGFVETRSKLREMGFSAKRGLLLYGPPGTGKTHFIRYIISNLEDHTAFLVTAEQVGAIEQIMVLARAMQPSIVIIEDADLIARSREQMESACDEVLLNKLLNEMDGLTEDSEILFVLTTNRPEQLEDAIRNRPGRIDQAIEIPKPDAECRARLFDLYRMGVEIPDQLRAECVQRTEGVTASFMRELARRMTQFAILRGDSAALNEADMRMAFEDLFGSSALNASVLGASE